MLAQWAAWAFESVAGYKWHRKLRRESGEVYMDRWQLIKSRLLCVYVNRINMPDYDDLPHNHPWAESYSLKLCGAYTEDVFEKASVVYQRITGEAWPLAEDGLIPMARMPPRWSRIPDIHRIAELTGGKPCWTLFIGFGRRPGGDSAWGFVQSDGTVIDAKTRKAARGVTSED